MGPVAEGRSSTTPWRWCSSGWIARAEDTNIVKRRGRERLDQVHREAEELLAGEGPSWEDLLRLDESFIREGLSPERLRRPAGSGVLFLLLGGEKGRSVSSGLSACGRSGGNLVCTTGSRREASPQDDVLPLGKFVGPLPGVFPEGTAARKFSHTYALVRGVHQDAAQVRSNQLLLRSSPWRRRQKG